MSDEDRMLLLKLMDEYGIADIVEELAYECDRRAARIRDTSMQPLATKWKWWQVTLQQALKDRQGVDNDMPFVELENGQ
jgi:hypothetical protein